MSENETSQILTSEMIRAMSSAKFLAVWPDLAILADGDAELLRVIQSRHRAILKLNTRASAPVPGRRVCLTQTLTDAAVDGMTL